MNNTVSIPIDWIRKIVEFRDLGDIKKNDVLILFFLTTYLKFDEFKSIKNSDIAYFTGLSKSEVSKAMTRLKDNEILVESDDEYEIGYKLNYEKCNV
ncbi:hypothetical protein P5F24_11150 [Clostridium perfringens]|nr:hypothetical protein [Clostridium perfringens]MDM0816253.1 hypothetical protein [Clostridium perfringens]